MSSPAPPPYPGKIKRRPPTELRLQLLFEAGFAVHRVHLTGYPVSLRRSGRVAEGGALLRR